MQLILILIVVDRIAILSVLQCLSLRRSLGDARDIMSDTAGSPAGSNDAKDHISPFAFYLIHQLRFNLIISGVIVIMPISLKLRNRIDSYIITELGKESQVSS